MVSENAISMLCQPTSMSSPSRNGERHQPRAHAPQDFLYPAYTNDYRIVNGACGGLGMVANRDMKKGEMVLTDSIEYLFADVQEGDNIIMVGHEMASRESETSVPERIPLTRDMLIRTHGVPVLESDPSNPESAGIEFYRLEVPWMFVNHSCDPNVVDSSHKEPEGEGIAARDIKKGEELTYDYTHQYYDRHLHSFECLCGVDNCRRFVTGFQGLAEDHKELLWPHVSDYIKVRHFADTGRGPMTRIQHPVFPERKQTGAMRLVVPGPSCAESQIALRKDPESGDFRLFALKDFEFGEEVYSFWNFVWPEQGKVDIDMVAASDLWEGDAPEGTVIRVNPLQHGVRDIMGRIRFSSYAMMMAHSCEPNSVYNHKDEDEEDDWRTMFAARPIKKGDMLTMDYNTIWWDRSEASSDVCTCGSAKCRGTSQGYSHITKEQQAELMSLSWLRLSPPYTGETRMVSAGDALAPHIHHCLRKDNIDHTSDATDLSVSSSNNSNSFDGHSSESEGEE